MLKKHTAILLSIVIAFTMVGGGVLHAAAAPVGHGTYKPSEGVETYKYYFAMPGSWINNSTHENNDVAGVYWWSAPDDPDTKFGHGWPGYEMDKEDGYENLWSVNAPKLASILVFNNYLDSGRNSTLPIFKNAQQCLNKNVEYYNEGDADTYSQKFWEYMWTKAAKQIGFDTEDPDFDYTSDEVYEAMIDPANADKIDFSDEFGEYGKNFYAELENESGLAMNFQNMVYVVDLDPAHIKTVNEDLIPGGKPAYDGEFYFYYGNGEYGMWPTKELALRMEGVTQNEDGSYSGGTSTDKYGTIYNAKGQVIIGDFTGLYSIHKSVYTDENHTEISFRVPTEWSGFKKVYLYLYNLDNNKAILPLNSKDGIMTFHPDGKFSFDFANKNFYINKNNDYICRVYTDNGLQTSNLFINKACFGDTIYCTGKQIAGNEVDQNQISYQAEWEKADNELYGIPRIITVTGQVIGEAYPKGKDNLELFTQFVSSQVVPNIKSVADITGETEQEIIDRVAKQLPVYLQDIESSIHDSDLQINWKKEDSDIRESLIFFKSPQFWYSPTDIRIAIYCNNSGKAVIPMDSVKGKLTESEEELWSYDLRKNNVYLNPEKEYSCVFYTPSGLKTSPIVLSNECLQKTAYCSGETLESENGTTNNWIAKWENKDEVVKIGDVNNDGTVNGADAGVLSRFAAGWKGYEDKIKNMTAADINGDSVVNGADAGILARYTSGWKQYDKYFS